MSVPNLVIIAYILFENYEGPTKWPRKKSFSEKCNWNFHLNVIAKDNNSLRWPFTHYSTPTWRCAWIFLLSLFATLCTAMFRQILQIRSLCYPGLHTTFLLSIYLFLMQVATVCNFLYPCTLRVEFFYHLFVLFSSNYVCQLRYHSVFFMKLILFVVPQLKNKATGDTAIRICFLPCHLCLEHLFHTACFFTSLALSLVEHDFHPNHVGFVWTRFKLKKD